MTDEELITARQGITLQELMMRAERLLEQMKAIGGYDTVHLYEVAMLKYNEEEYTVTLSCHDEFQKNLDYKQKCESGHISFYFNLDVADPQVPADHPLREERELTVLAKQHAGTDEMEKQMASVAGRDFMTRLAEARSHMGLRLKDLREEQESRMK